MKKMNVVFVLALLACLPAIAEQATGTPVNLVVSDFPIISDQPNHQIRYTHQAATFSVTAFCPDAYDAPAQYSWWKGPDPTNLVELPNETGSSLVIPDLNLNHAGTYWVRVGTKWGDEGPTTLSVGAVLTVRKSLFFTKPPIPQTFVAGSSLFLWCEVFGESPFTYQWKKDGATIAGATGTTYQKANAQVSDSGTYTVTVWDVYGNSLTSSAAIIEVRATPEPYPVWKFTHTTGASTATLVVNNQGISLPCLVIGTIPPETLPTDVAQLFVVFKDTSGVERVVRIATPGGIPATGDSSAYTIDGSTAVDWFGAPAPFDLGTFAGTVTGGLKLPAHEPRINPGTTVAPLVKAQKNGVDLAISGVYYAW